MKIKGSKSNRQLIANAAVALAVVLSPAAMADHHHHDEAYQQPGTPGTPAPGVPVQQTQTPFMPKNRSKRLPPEVDYVPDQNPAQWDRHHKRDAREYGNNFNQMGTNPALTNPVLNPAYDVKYDKHGRQHFANVPTQSQLIPVPTQVPIDYGYKHHDYWRRSHNWFGTNQALPSFVPRNYYTGIPQNFFVNANILSTADIDAQKTALASTIQAAAMQKRIPGAEATQLAMMLNQFNMDETNAVARTGGRGVSINDHAMLLYELQSIANSVNGFGGYNLSIMPWVNRALF